MRKKLMWKKAKMKQTLVAALLMVYVIAFAGCQEEPVADLPDADLGGTLWTLQFLDVPAEPDIQPDANKTFNIQFFEDYHLEAWVDCNKLYAEYALTAADLIQFDNLLITELNCPESSNSLAQQYLEGLRTVDSYGIIGNRLRLHFDDSVLKFRSVE